MDSREFMFCWKPGTDDAKLVPWPDTADTARGYTTTLACFHAFREFTFEQRQTQILSEALHAIVRDSVPAMAVHRALLPLAEYRDACADDMPGVREYRDKHDVD